MSLICTIPILATIGNERNLRIQSRDLKIVLYFVPFAFVSSWIISTLRYSYGIPLKLFSGDGKTYSWWLGNLSTFGLILTLILYAATIFQLIATSRKNLINE
jgi:hypothetical protein